MTAILDQSQALLKERYGSGLPKALYERKKLKLFQSVKKRNDFSGKYRDVPLQNENPQGTGTSIEIAQGSMYQGNYVEWNIPRRRFYAVARVTGEALRACKDDDGAFADLWRNEADGVAMQAMEDTEVFMFGNGTGVRGTISAGSTVGSATITLATVSDAVKFKLNMRVGAVSSATSLSPTVRSGSARITAIDRKNGTLTVGTTWSGEITGLVAGDSLVRYGDHAVSGTPAVIEGFQSCVAGGTTPGTLFGLNRNSDPVRLAGQTLDCSDKSMDEAVIDAAGLVSQQGGEQPTVAWIHPLNLANWKKSHQGRVKYDRAEVQSPMNAKVSFKGIVIEGDDGEPVVLMTCPFVPYGECPMVNMDDFVLDTLGGAVSLLDEDGQEVTRTPTSDAYETRFGTYGNFYTTRPLNHIRLTSFGT